MAKRGKWTKGVDNATKFTEAQRAIGVQLVDKHGGHVTKDALAAIREAIGVADLRQSTVNAWWTRHLKSQSLIQANAARPIDATIAATEVAARKALDQLMEDMAYRLLEHASDPDVIKRMPGRDTMYSVQVAINGMQSLRNMPPELVDLVPMMVAVYKRHGVYARNALAALLQQLEAIPVEGTSSLPLLGEGEGVIDAQILEDKN